MAPLETLLHDERTNAVVSWVAVGALALAAVVSALSGNALWALLAVVVAVAIGLPALATRDWRAQVPWPLALLAAVAVIGPLAGLPDEIAGYVAVSAVALVVVVELDVFTSVDLSRRFAVAFAVLTAMAVQAVWTVAQFYSDRLLATDYITSKTELQWDFVVVTVVALAFGALFELYVRRFEHVGSHRRPPGKAEST
ncbi:hypothetical protein [Halosimplex amylolyticum]|uniref:hypothetical protein n=1 Tax=Halosimplex amylolyticum TaxID=3396616 RepID=UPI003F561A19